MLRIASCNLAPRIAPFHASFHLVIKINTPVKNTSKSAGLLILVTDRTLWTS
jgi:hypothetical protein